MYYTAYFIYYDHRDKEIEMKDNSAYASVNIHWYESQYEDVNKFWSVFIVIEQKTSLLTFSNIYKSIDWSQTADVTRNCEMFCIQNIIWVCFSK